MGFEHREYIGTVVAPFDANRRKPSKGGWYLDFNVEQTDGKIIPCRAYEEVVEAAAAALEIGKKIALFGYLSGEQLRVKVIREAERPAVQKHLAYNGQTPDEVLAEFRARRLEMAKKGFLPVREGNAVSWHPEAFVIRVNNKNLLKIDFCVEKLGGKFVAHKLRRQNFLDIAGGKVRIAPQFGRLYRQILDALVEEAKAVDEAEF